MNKCALITGGASGIGLAVSRRLIEDGYDLIVHYHCSERESSALQLFAKSNKRSVTFIPADFSNEASQVLFMQSVPKTKINLFIHCAGINEKKYYADLQSADYERVFAVNMKVPIFLTQKLLVEATFARAATIVYIGSPNTYIGGSKRNILYTASKSALVGLTKTLAKELAPNIRVNCVVPGYIETRMLLEKNNKSALKKKRSLIPMRRFGTPEEVADLVSFLVSDKAAYITGQCIHVNGGLYLG